MDYRQLILVLSLTFTLTFIVAGCATRPPDNPDNLCEIFREKPDWYRHARRAADNWGTPIGVTMAIMRQESTFVHDARPPRRWILGFIPWFRPSSAYGYAQVKDDTWDWYREKASNRFANRSHFADAVDFIAWYGFITQQINQVSPTDAQRLYLNYHEGHGGYRRGSYRGKAWLEDVARRVSRNAEQYRSQLASCEDELKQSWWQRLLPFV
jgi:hypothetical protein